jgi:hypothetical protein
VQSYTKEGIMDHPAIFSGITPVRDEPTGNACQKPVICFIHIWNRMWIIGFACD